MKEYNYCWMNIFKVYLKRGLYSLWACSQISSNISFLFCPLAVLWMSCMYICTDNSLSAVITEVMQSFLVGQVSNKLVLGNPIRITINTVQKSSASAKKKKHFYVRYFCGPLFESLHLRVCNYLLNIFYILYFDHLFDLSNFVWVIEQCSLHFTIFRIHFL